MMKAVSAALVKDDRGGGSGGAGGGAGGSGSGAGGGGAGAGEPSSSKDVVRGARYTARRGVFRWAGVCA